MPCSGLCAPTCDPVASIASAPANCSRAGIGRWHAKSPSSRRPTEIMAARLPGAPRCSVHDAKSISTRMSARTAKRKSPGSAPRSCASQVVMHVAHGPRALDGRRPAVAGAGVHEGGGPAGRGAHLVGERAPQLDGAEALVEEDQWRPLVPRRTGLEPVVQPVPVRVVARRRADRERGQVSTSGPRRAVPRRQAGSTSCARSAYRWIFPVAVFGSEVCARPGGGA